MRTPSALTALLAWAVAVVAPHAASAHDWPWFANARAVSFSGSTYVVTHRVGRGVSFEVCRRRPGTGRLLQRLDGFPIGSCRGWARDPADLVVARGRLARTPIGAVVVDEPPSVVFCFPYGLALAAVDAMGRIAFEYTAAALFGSGAELNYCLTVIAHERRHEVLCAIHDPDGVIASRTVSLVGGRVAIPGRRTLLDYAANVEPGDGAILRAALERATHAADVPFATRRGAGPEQSARATGAAPSPNVPRAAPVIADALIAAIPHARALALELGHARGGFDVARALWREHADRESLVAHWLPAALAPGGEQLLPDIVRLAHHPRAGVRRRAYETLADLGPRARAVTHAIREGLCDDDHAVRSAALEAWYAIAPGRALDPRLIVRVAAPDFAPWHARVLDARALPALETLRTDPREAVRTWAESVSSRFVPQR